VIADDYVDKAFGTGVVKVTPAHDQNDYAVGQRHKLPMIGVLTRQSARVGVRFRSGMLPSLGQQAIGADEQEHKEHQVSGEGAPAGVDSEPDHLRNAQRHAACQGAPN